MIGGNPSGKFYVGQAYGGIIVVAPTLTYTSSRRGGMRR